MIRPAFLGQHEDQHHARRRDGESAEEKAVGDVGEKVRFVGPRVELRRTVPVDAPLVASALAA